MLGFRVWKPLTKKFDGSGIYSIDKEGRLIANDGFYVEDSQGIAMQSTGLKDFQGKEIYEGDIIWIRYDTDPCGNNYPASKVATEYLHVKNVTDFLRYIGSIEGINKISVEGNIYENPLMMPYPTARGIK